MNLTCLIPPLLRLAMIGVVAQLNIAAASAGTIEKTADPIMGCFAELSGKIIKGDADKLRPLVEELHSTDPFRFGGTSIFRTRGRVCLNSEGGSLEEGVALAKLFHKLGVGTAVGRNKNCLSACAVAFMGGVISHENDSGKQPDRVLHPTSNLGFHAPDLGVPAGEYTEQAVKKAYLIAVHSVSSVLKISPMIDFPLSLSTQMLATPATDMYFVTTVGEAARWRIAVAPIVEPASFTNKGLVKTCHHIDSGLLDQELEFENQSLTNVAQQDTDMWEGTMADGFRQEAATGCTTTFYATRPGVPGRTLPSGTGIITGNWVDTWAYQTYAADTPIKSLALSDDLRGETRAAQIRTWERRLAGRCFVFRGSNIADNDPCSLVSVIRRTEDLREVQIDTFVWPSGGKTVVESTANNEGFEVARLNGVDTERDLEYKNTGGEQRAILKKIAGASGNTDPMIACWPNPASGNRFCFVDKETSANSIYFNGVEE